MRTKLYLPIISLLAMSVFVFISCDDSDSDTTKPVIELHEPEEGQALRIGSEYGVHFEMDLSDDVMLKSYMIENGLDKEIKQNSPLFFNSWGENLTEQGIAYIIDKYVSNMRNIRPDLFNVRVTPHTFRHSRAMHLLQSGVNLIYIRDLLGHVSIQTTEIYARADERAKREAIEKASEKIMPQLSPIENSWKKDKGLMEFLRSL